MDGVSRRLFLTSTACMAAMRSLPAAAQSEPGLPRVLRFTDHEPLGGMRTRFLQDVLFPAIERESGGRLKIEARWDGEVAAAYDALAVVANGTSDMGTVVPEYTAEELPLHQVFKSFVRGPAGQRQVDFFNRVYAELPQFRIELEKNDIVPVFFGTGYPVAFFSSSPLADLGELRGGKWRSASFWHLDYLKNAGATPVKMHWGPEIAAALKAKTLDGLMVNVDSGYMLKVHETAPHVLVSKNLWLGHLYLLAMNRSVWHDLQQEDREAIVRAARKSYPMLGGVMETSFDAQLAELRNAGADARILRGEEVSRFEASTDYREVQSSWARDQERLGIPGTAAVIAKVSSILGEFI
ncbi:ABC transporter substrate-binding protein [Rhizobium sp. Leaf384]|nr:ABC transporter substrate-binding protein [Rhizobium sp. Leaf384]